MLATRSTMAKWRHTGTGPEYSRYGKRVFYLGSALNTFLQALIVHTDTTSLRRMHPPTRHPSTTSHLDRSPANDPLTA